MLSSLSVFTILSAHAAENSRPFWAEKSSYAEGDTLYGVGVATQAKSQESGRQTAYENGKKELSNFAQITDLSGLAVETQMTYEEMKPDGTFNVFRLLKVNLDELTRWKKQLLARATAQLEKQNQEVGKEVARKKREVENLERQTTESAALDERAAAIRQRIKGMTNNVSRYIRCGMTMDEVRSLLGEPRTVDRNSSLLKEIQWNYGEYWLRFQNGVLAEISTHPYSGGRCP